MEKNPSCRTWILKVRGLDSGSAEFFVCDSCNVNVNVIVVLNANVLRLDEDRRQRRSGISIWT